jgi:hypothetical protein
MDDGMDKTKLIETDKGEKSDGKLKSMLIIFFDIKVIVY